MASATITPGDMSQNDANRGRFNSSDTQSTGEDLSKTTGKFGHRASIDKKGGVIVSEEHRGSDATSNDPEKTTEARVYRVDYSGAAEKSDPREIRLVRKLDWHIMPILWAMYFLNYVDRNAITQARLNGLEADLGLRKEQYQTCIGILFVGYITMQIPSNMLMSSKKVKRISVYMGFCMFCWAVVSACTALATNYAGLALVRFFLGVTEAPFYPGALYVLSLFYTRKEQAFRVALLYLGNMLATGFSGLIAAGMFSALDGSCGLAGWQWLFIIEGAATAVIAFISVFLLPDNPLQTKWLTEEERQLAHARIERDTVNCKSDEGPFTALREVVKNRKLWILVVLQNMHLSACSFNNFFPTVVKSLGFDNTVTLLLTCPPFVTAAICCCIASWSSGKSNERAWHISTSISIAIVGFIISCTTLNLAARYVACFFFAAGAYAINGIVMAWVSATVAETKQKKAISLSIVNTLATLSYIYTPYLYPKSDGPKYLTAMASNAAFCVVMIMTVWYLRYALKRENARMRQAGDSVGKVFYAY